MDLQRIKEMEERLNRCTAATADLDRQLDRMEELREEVAAWRRKARRAKSA